MIKFYIGLVLIGVALVAIKIAWTDFEDWIGKPYADAQLVADTKNFDLIKEDRDRWHAAEAQREIDNGVLGDKLTEQTTATDKLNEKYLASLKRTVGIIAAHKAERTRTAYSAEQETDRGIVLTAQPPQTDAKELQAIDAVVLDALGLKPASPAQPAAVK